MRYITTLIFLALSLGLSAQQYNIRGKIIDADEAAMPGVSVFLLDASDSTFVQFASTNAEGYYELKSVASGSYLLQTPFVGYKTLYTPLKTEGDNKDIKVSDIHMQEDNQLDEVVVETDAIPMKMNGDTLEYNARAFKTRPNDVAEDLIRRLPGVDVDKDGNIRTQGEDVGRVLVNGKEFFGNDTKTATKNLPAESIEKVQVFDRKSDQAELSGIDDGNTEKTINIELKEDHRKGYFGRLNGGYGYNDDDLDQSVAGGKFDRYEFDLSLNRFSDNMQLAVLGQVNNVNKQGFSFSDYISFIGGYENFQSESGGNRWNFNSSGLSVPLGGSGTSGLSESYAGGLNFNYDFGKKTELMSSYFYSLYQNNLTQESYTENFIEEGTYISESEGERETQFGSHRVSLRFDHKFDSTNNLRVRGSFKKNDGDVYSLNQSRTFNVSDSLQNASFTEYTSESNSLDYNINALHSKRLKKIGRVLTTNVSLSNTHSLEPLFLNSVNTFYNYDPNIPFSSYDQVINQRQLEDQNSLNYSGRITYTEPIGKKRYIELNVSHENNNFASIREFYDIVRNTEDFNQLLSTNYTNEYLYTNTGLSFRQNRKKYNFTAGVNGQLTNLNGEIITTDTTIGKTFRDLLPRIDLNYKFTNSRRFLLRYDTRINAPSITQLQPAQNNTNPLNIYLGNSDLDRAYSHSLYLHYLSFSQFSGTNFFANLYTSYTTDKIVNATEINETTLARITQPINVDYDFSTNSYVSFGAPLNFMKSKINVSTRNGFSQGIVFVNGTENIADRYNNGVDFSIENTKKDVIDILTGVEFSRNNTQYSKNSEFNQTFFNTTYFIDLTLNFDRWLINTTFDYNKYTGNAFDTDQVVPIFNAYISRMMFENKRGELRLSAYDILNKNIGFDRTSNLNYLQEQRTNNLSRYFMLSFLYRITKNGKGEEGGMKWGSRRQKW